jgi:hypothetical protein
MHWLRGQALNLPQLRLKRPTSAPTSNFLRADVRAEKTAIMGQIMNLNDEENAKFWPIYHEYDVELQKLNDKKLAGVKGYAKDYDSMTDEKGR